MEKKNPDKIGRGPRPKTVIILAGTVGLMFICAATLVSLRIASFVNEQSETTISQFTDVIADLAQACGESGSIESLQLFLRNIERHHVIDSVHVVRSPVTVKDFDERTGNTSPDEIEKEVLKGVTPIKIVDRANHTIRYVRPTTAEERCTRRCHESAKVGDVLGVSSVTVCTEEIDSGRARITWLMILVFSAAAIVEIVLVVAMVARDNAEKDRLRAEETNRKLRAHVKEVEELAAKAEEANRFKSEFLANMSHEIRTPMNAIIGFTELLLQEELADDVKRYLRITFDSAQHLLELINDILDFSRIEAGRLAVEMTECDLDELVRSIDSMMGRGAVDKGLEFKVIVENELPAKVCTDPQRLRQCLWNLIGNAFKFTEHGHVHVKVRLLHEDGQSWIHFAVEDTGIGIPADKHELIFDAFSQADGSSTRRFGGTGLGLSITRRLVELMGGRICVESVEGKGSIFSFAIPAETSCRKDTVERTASVAG